MDAHSIERVEDHFRSIAPLHEHLVNEFYRILFALHPDLRSLFSASMAAQHRKFREALTLVVAGLRDQEGLTDTLRALGRRHTLYGVTRDQYGVARDALLTALAQTSGPVWNEELRADWYSALNEVITLMADGAPP